MRDPPIFYFFLFFASSTEKSDTNYALAWMGLNFHYYDGFQPKMTPNETYAAQFKIKER